LNGHSLLFRWIVAERGVAVSSIGLAERMIWSSPFERSNSS
jgi:hypothetical protein